MKKQPRGAKTLEIIEHLSRNPRAKARDVVKLVGCGLSTVSNVRREYFPEALDHRYRSNCGIKSKVIKAMLSQPHLINARIAEQCQCTPAYVSLIRAEIGNPVVALPTVEMECPPDLFIFLYDEAAKNGDDTGPEDIARAILTDAMLDAQEAAE